MVSTGHGIAVLLINRWGRYCYFADYDRNVLTSRPPRPKQKTIIKTIQGPKVPDGSELAICSSVLAIFSSSELGICSSNELAIRCSSELLICSSGEMVICSSSELAKSTLTVSWVLSHHVASVLDVMIFPVETLVLAALDLLFQFASILAGDFDLLFHLPSSC